MKNILFLFLAFLTLTGCRNQTSNIEAQTSQHAEENGIVQLTEAQLKSVQIEFGKVEMKNLSSVISVNGVLDVPPQNMVSVSALMGGFIKSTQLLQGLRVKKGQAIATIQNLEFIKVQSAYLENKSRLVYLEQEYKRQEELSRDNVSPSKIFQQVTAEYHSLQATVGALEEQLKILNIDPLALNISNIRSTVTIYSPINGHVTAVNVNLGKYVNPQDIICEIVDTDHLHAELTVFEKDISKIRKGQKIRFILVNEGGKERTATVYLINRQISQERTVRVHAHLDKEDPELLPNMFLKALIEVGQSNKTTAVPEQAIVNVGDKFYIFIKDNDQHHHINEPSEKEDHGQTFQAIEVSKGVTENGYSEVILPGGFEIEKSEIVVKGAYDLLAKMNNSEEEEHTH